jgi:hypothetical protein
VDTSLTADDAEYGTTLVEDLKVWWWNWWGEPL